MTIYFHLCSLNLIFQFPALFASEQDCFCFSCIKLDHIIIPHSMTALAVFCSLSARQVQVAAVESVALYEAELWWQGQKDRLAGIQLMINRQARAITGMLKSTPIGPLVREASLAPAEVLLEARQLRYTTRLLSMPSLGSRSRGTDNGLREATKAHGPWDNTSLDN